MMALLIAFCTLPDTWMYGSTLMAGNLLSERAMTAFIGLVASCVFFSGFLVLISLPCMGQSLGVRWIEGFWFVAALLFVQICSMIAYTRMQSSFCIFEANIDDRGNAVD